MESTRKETPPAPSPPADGAGGDDRISALDDGLCELILVLAHLNMRELVRTSVLSKRWRGLWKRLPVVHLFGWPELESASDVERYIAVVNDVLEQRAGAASEARIDEVKIPLDISNWMICHGGQLDQLQTLAMEASEAWIRYAMHHQVKGFRLNLRLHPLLVKRPVIMDLNELLPSSPKLERMHLGLCLVEVRLPRTAVFASLKDLTLEFVSLSAGSNHLLTLLLSSVCCPSLQKLRLVSVRFDILSSKELVLDAGELLELSMDDVKNMGVLDLTTPKLLYLRIKECHGLESVRVSVPGLKELTYVGNTGIVHGPLLCLWCLQIDLVSHKVCVEDDDEVHNLYEISNNNICLLKRCSSSVRCLLVHLYVTMGGRQHVGFIEDNIPQLANVTSLKVSINEECQRHSFGDGVASLLTRLKNLEYLCLVLRDSPNIFCDKADEYYTIDDVDSAFTCNHPDHWESSNISLANLRKADFWGMTGTGCELRFLRFVLANATDLQRLTVSFNLWYIVEKELYDSRMHYFLHTLRGGGTWTTCEAEDLYKLYKCSSKLYKWTPSP